MVWCKCLDKIRDKNGIITAYEVIDFEGNKRVVRKEILKQTLLDNSIGVVNLKLSKDGKIVNRSTTEESELTAKLTNNTLSEKDTNTILKAKMLGVAGRVNEYGILIGVTGNKVIITPDVKTIAQFNLPNLSETTFVFLGNNEINIGRIQLKKAEIHNKTLIDDVLKHDIIAKTIEIHDDNNTLTDKIYDIVFKAYKSEIENGSYDILEEILVYSNNISKEQAYSKIRAILKRQKPSSKEARRMYDLIAYIRLIKSVALTYGDKEFLDEATPYIQEYRYLGSNRSFGRDMTYVDWLEAQKQNINKLIHWYKGIE